VEDITSANRGVRPRFLRRGERLIIPTSGARLAGSYSAVARSGRSAAPRSAATGTRMGGQAARTRRVHIVRAGETLSGIAEQFGVPLSLLLGENRLTLRSPIRPGQAIRLPG
jgi:LysM repeat protein